MKKRVVNWFKRLNPAWFKWRAAALLLLVGIIILIVVLLQRPLSSSEKEPEDPNLGGSGMNIYIDDIYNGRVLIPDFDMELNTYAREQFSENAQGYKTYPNAKLGVDVSSHQQQIDWAQVKSSGVEFAIIRAGYRGMTEGGVFVDEFFHQNMQEAIANDIDVGVYFFSQAISVEEAEEEAAFVLNEIKDYEISYPIVFDWETIAIQADGTVPRTHNVDMEHLALFTEAFCKTIENGGKTPAYYTNKHLGYNGFNLEYLKNYDMWYAEYQPQPSFYYHFDIWQYTESGTVPGISTNVDINLSFKEYP